MIDQIMYVLATALILFALFLVAAGISKLVDIGSEEIERGWDEKGLGK
jgi:hypothetical protein